MDTRPHSIDSSTTRPETSITISTSTSTTMGLLQDECTNGAKSSESHQSGNGTNNENGNNTINGAAAAAAAVAVTTTRSNILTTSNSNTTVTGTTSIAGLAMTTSSSGRPVPRLTHSVSIFVEPALEEHNSSGEAAAESENTLPPPPVAPYTRRHSAGPVLILQESEETHINHDENFKQEELEFVESIMAHARLRKEEFARLLEEHAQIVNEINRAETKLL